MSSFFYLMVFASLLNGIDLSYWSHIYTYKLKKDQLATVLIQKEDPSSTMIDSNLSFRWTLFQNKALIILVNYEKFPTQYTLYNDKKQNSIRFYLEDYTNPKNRAYLFLEFSEFDDKNKKAIIKTYIKDPLNTIKSIKWIEGEVVAK